jgi:hypothetical protein
MWWQRTSKTWPCNWEFEAQPSTSRIFLGGLQIDPLKLDRLHGADPYVVFDHQTGEFGPVGQHDSVRPVG